MFNFLQIYIHTHIFAVVEKRTKEKATIKYNIKKERTEKKNVNERVC